MRLDSVETVELGRDDGREQLTLRTRERGGPGHDGQIVFHTGLHDPGIEAHDMNDVPHATSATGGFIELLLEVAGGVVDRDLIDPGHDQ